MSFQGLSQEQTVAVGNIKGVNSFWKERIVWKDNGDVIEDEGHFARWDNGAYAVLPESKGAMLGFGGREVNIYFVEGKLVGKVIKTNNLRFNGEIPSNLREVLTTNALIEWIPLMPMELFGEVIPKQYKYILSSGTELLVTSYPDLVEETIMINCHGESHRVFLAVSIDLVMYFIYDGEVVALKDLQSVN